MCFIFHRKELLHDEILVGDLSKFGIKYLTIECQPDKELEEMKAVVQGVTKKQLVPLRY